MIFPQLPAHWLIAECCDQESAADRADEESEPDGVPGLLCRKGDVRVVRATLRGPLDLTSIIYQRRWGTGLLNALTGETRDHHGGSLGAVGRRLDLVIVSGEVGPDARPLHPDWVRAIRDQCVAADVPFWFAGWGEWLPYTMGEAYMDSFDECQVLTPGEHGWPVYRVGADRSGRTLDGREWSELPKGAT